MQVVEIWRFTGKINPAALRGRKRTCDPGGIRTHDPQLRRLLLYPAELLDPKQILFCECKISVFSQYRQIYFTGFRGLWHGLRQFTPRDMQLPRNNVGIRWPFLYKNTTALK